MYIFKKEGYQLPFRYLCCYSYFYANIEKITKEFEIKILGNLTKARVLEQAAYDPNNEKLTTE